MVKMETSGEKCRRRGGHTMIRVQIVVPVMFLLIMSTSGFPSHKIREKHYLGSVRSYGSLQPLMTTINGHPKTVNDKPMLRATEGDEPPERMAKEDEPPETLTEEYEPPETSTKKDEPPERKTEKDEPPERITEYDPPEGVTVTDGLPARTLGEGQPKTLPLILPISADLLVLSTRDKRAVVWKVPKIRIPSITRLFKPKAKRAPSPSGAGGGLPTATAPLPKGGPQSRPSGADSSSLGGKKSRTKGGSKSGESNSFPDLGDLPSPDGWDFPDFSPSDSAAGSSSESATNVKEEESKTTTQKSKKKWDDHHHLHHGQHSPDYDYHHGCHYC